MVQQIENEYDDECLWYDHVSLSGCDQDRSMKDALGMTWCDIHAYRGNLINWGATHNWPNLQFTPYAIGPGDYCWAIAAKLGNDDFIGLAAAYVELLDEQEVA